MLDGGVFHSFIREGSKLGFVEYNLGAWSLISIVINVLHDLLTVYRTCNCSETRCSYPPSLCAVNEGVSCWVVFVHVKAAVEMLVNSTMLGNPCRSAQSTGYTESMADLNSLPVVPKSLSTSFSSPFKGITVLDQFSFCVTRNSQMPFCSQWTIFHRNLYHI